MKIFLLIVGIVILICIWAIQSGHKAKIFMKEERGAEITYLDTVYSFGKIAEGEQVSHSFIFTNTGNIPLIFKDAQTSCGCTVPIYPSKPILPGETSEVKVLFNSLGKSGMQDKIIDFTTNATTPQPNLHLKGIVVRH